MTTPISIPFRLTEETVDAVRRPRTEAESRDDAIVNLLQPGDCLIYWTPCIADVVIGIKTWSRRAAHIEIYEGDGMSTAARAQGVNAYSLRLEGLQYIRRPVMLPRWQESRAYFEQHCRGCKYAWESLFSFAVARAIKSHRRMFCSDYATRRYRAAGGVPFDIDYASQLVPPDYFLVTPAFWTVWDRSKNPELRRQNT